MSTLSSNRQRGWRFWMVLFVLVSLLGGNRFLSRTQRHKKHPYGRI